MEDGTDPVYRWYLRYDASDREECWNRTNVTLVERGSLTRPYTTSLTKIEDLKEALQTATAVSSVSHPDDAVSGFKVLLVEDLSREIIELLGSRYDVDPLFFANHIRRQSLSDHEAFGSQRLLASRMRQKWFQISNTRLRFHDNSDKNMSAIDSESRHFNIFRPLKYDSTTSNYYPQGTVSITDSKTSIWVGKDKWCQHSNIGIVLVDPTITDGRSLSYDRDACMSMPEPDGVNTGIVPASKGSWHEDLVEMTVRYPWFSTPDSTVAVDPLVMVYPTVFTICAEWLNVCEWVVLRLDGIEASFYRSELSGPTSNAINTALAGLETWRRELPVWKKMVDETLEESLLIAARLMTSKANPQNEEVFADIMPDFKRVKHTLDILQSRVDRLADRGTVEMQLIAAQQSLAESHSLARLTWLATIFIPMTFMTGLFSMNDNIASLRPSFKTYFIVAIPLAVLALFIARWGPGIMRLVLKWNDYVLRPIVDIMESRLLEKFISRRQLVLRFERRINKRR
jgi:hypothetical protein